MRYPKPEAGKIARVATNYIPGADYLGGFSLVLLAIASIAVGLPLAIIMNFWFSLLMLPALVSTTMYAEFFRGSVKAQGTDYSLSQANRYLEKMRGEYTEHLALPIAKKIFAHQAAGGHTTYSGSCYGDCAERLEVMERLVPATKSIDDTSDMKNALEFLKARKELE